MDRLRGNRHVLLVMIAATIFFCCAMWFFLKESAVASKQDATANPAKAASKAEVESKALLLGGEQRLPCLYYNRNDFLKSVSSALRTLETDFAPAGAKRSILVAAGGVVPHHLLARDMIASFFSAVSKAAPDAETVFVLGPNHNRAGSRRVHTGTWSWETDFGLLEADTDAACHIAAASGAGADFDLLRIEHSVAALAPYIKYFMPSAKIVPMLLHGDLSIEESENLARAIFEAGRGKSWIAVASIDFSHYLAAEEADRMDEITLKAVIDRNFFALSRMGNDNLDCPPAMIALLKLMELEGADGPRVIGHSNSARIAGLSDGSGVTSYFAMIFDKPALLNKPAKEKILLKPGDDIQEAVGEVADGGEIVLSSGVYDISSPIEIRNFKSITIRGSEDGRAEILGEDIDEQIIVVRDCGNVEIKNVRACHKSSKNRDSAGEKVFAKRLGSVVDAENCAEITLEGCELEGCGVYGVYTANVSKVNIFSCHIHHNSWMGLGFRCAPDRRTEVLIRGSRITNNANLLETEGCVNIIWREGNIIENNNSEGYNSGR